MDLRLALLIIGAALVAIVFGISRYSSFFQKHLNRWKKILADRKPHHVSWSRDAKNAPVLGNSADGNARKIDHDEDRLFNFDSDTDEEGLRSDNQLIVDNQDVLETGSSQTIIDQGAQVSDPQTQLDNGEEIDTLATLEDNHVHQMRKPVGPFTSLRQIDFWIKLSPSSPVTQSDIVAKLSEWGTIRFPVQLHALTQEEPHWVNLLEADADTAIMDVVASYQLLDNGLAATLDDLHVFERRASELGTQLDAEKLMMATPEQALEQSLKLSAFFAGSSEPLEVSICAPEGQAFMGKLVETSAKQQGLDFMDGEYVRQKRMASHNVVLYRMVNHDTSGFERDMPSNAHIECVKFTMLPALSRTPGRDAKEMLDAVKAFASRVKGEIRIPGEREFHQDLLLKLRNRVSNLEKDIVAAGLEPGGLEISRIFS